MQRWGQKIGNTAHAGKRPPPWAVRRVSNNLELQKPLHLRNQTQCTESESMHVKAEQHHLQFAPPALGAQTPHSTVRRTRFTLKQSSPLEDKGKVSRGRREFHFERFLALRCVLELSALNQCRPDPSRRQENRLRPASHPSPSAYFLLQSSSTLCPLGSHRRFPRLLGHLPVHGGMPR